MLSSKSVSGSSTGDFAIICNIFLGNAFFILKVGIEGANTPMIAITSAISVFFISFWTNASMHSRWNTWNRHATQISSTSHSHWVWEASSTLPSKSSRSSLLMTDSAVDGSASSNGVTAGTCTGASSDAVGSTAVKIECAGDPGGVVDAPVADCVVSGVWLWFPCRTGASAKILHLVIPSVG